MIDLCNNEEWLAAYLDRRLSGGEQRLYENHIARCPRCLANLVASKRELDEMTASSAATNPSRWGRGAPARET
jgi:anti-sigma factor RsiW